MTKCFFSNKKQNCFALYRSDGTLVDYGTVNADGAFSYEKPGQFYSIVSYTQTTEHVDEGEQEPNDWNTDADLDRLRRAQYVIVADESVAITESIEVARKLDELDTDLWCVVIGAPPPQYVKGKTTFLLSDAAEDDQKTSHLKMIADSIVDKNDERVFILSKDLKGLLGTLAFPRPALERVNRLITLSTPYEGRDEERAQEMKRALAARRAATLTDVDDTRVLNLLPERLQKATKALASKFHVGAFAASSVLLTAFVAKQGHKRAIIKRGGDEVSPYIGVVLVGESGSGKSPLVRYAIKPFKTLTDKEKEKRKDDKPKEPALKKLVDEANKRYESANFALEAAKENADPDEIAKAEENADKEFSRLKDAIVAHAKVAAPLHNYTPQWASDKGVDWDLSQNDWSAEKQGKTPDGALVVFEEGSDILGFVNGKQTSQKWLNYMARLLDVTKNTGKTVTHESARDKFDERDIGCCFIILIQPGAIEADNSKTIVSTGSMNRFFWATVPDVDDLPTDDDVTADLKPWEELFLLDLKAENLQLDDDAQQILDDFCLKELPSQRGQARVLKKKTKRAFLSKLKFRVLQIARAFHLIKEGSRLLDTNDKQVKSLIDADTMKKAIEYCRVAVIERDNALEMIRNEKKEDNVPSISLDAQTIYNHQVKHAKDEWTNRSRFAASAPKLSLWTKANEERANAAEQELIDAGLWIIGQYGAKRNKRRAITLDEPNAITAPKNTGDDIPF